METENERYIVYVGDDGMVHKHRRSSQEQRTLIALLEDKLGYARANHYNLPMYKAMAMIDRYKARCERRNIK